MKKKNFLLFLISLGLCSALFLSIYLESMVAAAAVVSPSRIGELTAIDVSIEARPILDQLGIRYQGEPRLGYWRAAATLEQLKLLRQEGVDYRVAGNVTIVESGDDQTNQTDGIDSTYCNRSNDGNYTIPKTDWVYAPIFTNCPGTSTVKYIDVYYDVTHPWADNALFLNVGSNSPSWFYTNLEDKDSCTPPASPDWHKYQYNITAFNDRPVNQRWDLVAIDDCPGGPTGYIDYWEIWVYYTSPTPLPAPEASFISPEITISEDDRNDTHPAIAYNWKHHEYLVVWESIGPGGYHDVYARRVSTSGELLSWFAVGTSQYGKVEPAVAYDPVHDRYLVVWAYDYSGDDRDWDIYGRFIPWNGPDPNVTDFIICEWSSNQSQAAVAYARVQEEFMVVWETQAEGIPGYISGRMVYADGTGMSADFSISDGAEVRSSPNVTYNFTRNEFLVVFDIDILAGDLDIRGRRFQGNGTPIGDELIIADYIGAREERPSVAACYHNDQYLVAWQSDDGTGGTKSSIYARYLNGDAINGNIYIIDDSPNKHLNVDVSCNNVGTLYLVAWQHQYEVSGQYGIWARLAYPEESMTLPFQIISPGFVEDRQYPVIGAGKSSYLVAWEHERSDGNDDTHGRLLRYSLYLPVTISHLVP